MKKAQAVVAVLDDEAEWKHHVKESATEFPHRLEVPPLALGLGDRPAVGRRGVRLVLIQPAEWVLDAVTAVVLFAVLGFRWALLWALVVEAVPALQLFPAWTLVVAALASTENRKLTQSAGAVEGMPDHIKTKH